MELDKKGKDVEAVLKMAHNNNNLFSTEKLQLSTDLLDWFLTFCFRDQKLHRHQRRYRMCPTQPWGRLKKKIFLSTSSHVFPYYQGDSTIFHKRNFLKHSPDFMNL